MKRIANLCMFLAAFTAVSAFSAASAVSAVAQERSYTIPPVSGARYLDTRKAEKGFWGAADVEAGVSFSFKEGYKSNVPMGLNLTAGYRFNKFIQLGAGFGVRGYVGGNFRAPESKKVVLPVFVNVRGIMMDDRSRNVVPYWSANLGYTVFDGVYFSPTFGARFGSFERHHFTLGLSYTVQGTKLIDTTIPDGRKNGCFNYLSLRLGYQF